MPPLINAISGYHNLKLDERSLYLTMFSCPVGRYGYIRLPFRGAPARDVFQKKINELSSGMPNAFDTADDIAIIVFDEQGKNHDKTLEKVLQVCIQGNLKLTKDKCLFRCTSNPFFGKVISQQGVSPDPRKVQVLTDIPTLNSTKEHAVIPGYIKLPK